jgi:hypothetical protein
VIDVLPLILVGPVTDNDPVILDDPDTIEVP